MNVIELRVANGDTRSRGERAIEALRDTVLMRSGLFKLKRESTAVSSVPTSYTAPYLEETFEDVWPGRVRIIEDTPETAAEAPASHYWSNTIRAMSGSMIKIGRDQDAFITKLVTKIADRSIEELDDIRRAELKDEANMLGMSYAVSYDKALQAHEASQLYSNPEYVEFSPELIPRS